MADIPIIFSAPMIRALLDGRKTMTRRLAWVHPGKSGRVAKRQPEWPAGMWPSAWQNRQPDDRLWVRENLCQHGHFGFPLGSSPQLREIDNARVWSYDADAIGGHQRRIPCIHMPRWASRLTLIVTATKIERVQDISEDDAKAEGCLHRFLKAANCAPRSHYYIPVDLEKEHSGGTAKEAFEMLWRAINGHESWDANPEVVALTFTVHKQNIDALPKLAAA